MPEERIDLRGALVETDDFNDLQVPYKFVRPDGRSGSCFATSYREGAQYLLMLKKETPFAIPGTDAVKFGSLHCRMECTWAC
jgi:hypothetical protein